MKGWVLSLVVACAGVLAGCQSAPMLPPELAGYEPILAGLSEPPLFGANANDGFSQRIRIVVAPHYLQHPRMAVRLDQLESGLTSGVSIRGEEMRGRWVATERRPFRASAEEMARLDELIRDARIWETHEFERREGTCTDGTIVLLERVSASGHRLSYALAPCGTSREYLDVVRYIAGLAGEQLEGWLAY
jgi:hypothetical protein